MSADLLLAGGDLVDGTGARAVRADVAVADGRITAVGDLAGLTARTTLDCAGRTIVPGFIDVHSHADFLVPGREAGALVEPFVRQGMTTLVGGNCGFSPAPVTARNQRGVQDGSRLITDDAIEVRWAGMADFLDTRCAKLSTGSQQTDTIARPMIH